MQEKKIRFGPDYLPKLDVVGSNPIARCGNSFFANQLRMLKWVVVTFWSDANGRNTGR